MDQRTQLSPRIKPLPPEHSPELKEQFEAMRKNLGFVPNSILIMQRKPKLAKARVAESGISLHYGNLHPRLERLPRRYVERRARQRRCIDKTISPSREMFLALGSARCDALNFRLFFRLDFSGTTSPYVLLKLSFRRPPPLL